jgi:AraC-like DNA-binding protein
LNINILVLLCPNPKPNSNPIFDHPENENLMKLFIKSMVSQCCIQRVETELEQLGVFGSVVELGTVDLPYPLTDEQLKKLGEALEACGLEILEDGKSVLVEHIKNKITLWVRNLEEVHPTNFSKHIAKELGHNYTYLSNLFSKSEGITIEHYIILNKIEYIKELIQYHQLNMSEIADRLRYSSNSALSNQFKKVTGISPSDFKEQHILKRQSLQEL